MSCHEGITNEKGKLIFLSKTRKRSRRSDKVVIQITEKYSGEQYYTYIVVLLFSWNLNISIQSI